MGVAFLMVLEGQRLVSPDHRPSVAEKQAKPTPHKQKGPL
jgi:hypothetical protein